MIDAVSILLDNKTTNIMKKSLKITLLFTTTLLTLMFFAAVTLTVFIDPNDFKPQINHLVEKNTGRQLTIQGKILWSLFPWLGLKIDKLALSNAPGFGPEPLLEVGSARISIRLLDLLWGQMNIGALELHHATLRLARNKNGKTNWEDLQKRYSEQFSLPPKKRHYRHFPIRSLTISSIALENADIEWKDAQNQQNFTLQNASLHSQHIAPNQPFTVHTEFTINAEHPHVTLGIASSLLVDVDLLQDLYILKNAHLTATVHTQNPQHPQTLLHLKAVGQINASKASMDLQEVSIYTNTLQTQGTLKGSQLWTQPILTGKLQVLKFNPQEFAESIGYPLKVDAPGFLESASGITEFKIDSGAIKAASLRMTLDQTQIEGSVLWKYAPKTSLVINLHANQLNPLPYLQATTATKQLKTQPNAQTPTIQKIQYPANLNTQWLSGTLDIDRLQWGTLALPYAHIGFHDQNGCLYIDPISASLYQGKVKGKAQINLNDKEPLIDLYATLNKVNIATLLKTITGKSSITGSLDLKTALHTRGWNDTMQRLSLNGSGSFSLQDGYLPDIDVQYEIKKIAALLKKKNSSQAASSQHQTPYQSITGTFRIQNGVWHNKDLKLTASGLKVQGSGKIYFITGSTDYRLHVTQAGYNWSLPITITGPLFAPHIQPDAAGIGKALLGQKVQATIQKKIDAVRDKIDYRLKNLF